VVLTAGVSLHHAGIHCKALTTDQTFGNAAMQNRLEQPPEGVAVPEATMAVLGKGLMIRDLAFQTQPADPPVGQVEMDFLAQPPFRVDAVAIANDEDADWHIRVGRGPAGVAIASGQVTAQLAQIRQGINLAEKLVLGYVIFQAKIVKQCILIRWLLPHQRSFSTEQA